MFWHAGFRISANQVVFMLLSQLRHVTLSIIISVCNYALIGRLQCGKLFEAVACFCCVAVHKILKIHHPFARRLNLQYLKRIAAANNIEVFIQGPFCEVVRI